jgi:CPA1 family monovalent cation:H+ antiporter
MHGFQLLSLLIVAAAMLSYLNYRFLRLPPTIGVMVLAVALSAFLTLIPIVYSPAAGIRDWAVVALGKIHFDELLLHGMLAFLLFAGGLHINLSNLGSLAAPVALLALGGTIGSAFLLGFGLHAAVSLTGIIDLPLSACLLFGALISPTDPIAVLAIMRQVGAPKRMEIVIAGESLFNDGVAVVMFLTLLETGAGNHPMGASDIGLLLLREAGGGAAFGLATGAFAYYLLRRVDDFEVEILITLALAMGTYAAAEALSLSAPIAEVVAALVIGNQARARAMSEKTRANLDTFWGLVDSILNAVLFLLVGVQALTATFRGDYWIAGAIAIVLVLLARLVSVAAVGMLLRTERQAFLPALLTLTWGGLRGGISLALALSLPQSPARAPLVTITYLVVVFSMVVQGLTIGPLIRRLYRDNPQGDATRRASH